MSRQTESAGIIGIIGVAIFFIAAYPFIWLYEQVGGQLFFVIVLGISASALVYKDWKRSRNKKALALVEPVESTEEKAARKICESEEFHAQNIRVIQEREQQAQREYFLKKHHEKEQQKPEPRKARIHTVESEDGYQSIEWQQQFDEIKKAWSEGDYDFARTWLQKMAYAITNDGTPPKVHQEFKKLMVAFTREDPVYADIMRKALPVIKSNPGIVQSTLSKQFPQFDAELFRYVMYFGAESSDLIREKKGRSYTLFPPSKNVVRIEIDLTQEAVNTCAGMPGPLDNDWLAYVDQSRAFMNARTGISLPYKDGDPVPPTAECQAYIDSLNRLDTHLLPKRDQLSLRLQQVRVARAMEDHSQSISLNRSTELNGIKGIKGIKEELKGSASQ